MQNSEITTPFGLTPSGSISTTSDPIVQAKQHVTALVSTSPGERVMQPAYGVPLNAYVFEENASIVQTALGVDVRDAVAIWEPTISIISETPVYSDTSIGIASLDVDYTVGDGQSSLLGQQTATVLVGGTVVNN